MIEQRDIRRPRRTFPPEVARQILIGNAVMAVGTVVFWAFVTAWFGQKLGFW